MTDAEEASSETVDIVVVRVPKVRQHLAERAARKEGGKIYRPKSNGIRVAAIDFLDWRDHGIADGQTWVSSDIDPASDLRGTHILQELGHLQSAGPKPPTLSTLFRAYMKDRDTITVAVIAPLDRERDIRRTLEAFAR